MFKKILLGYDGSEHAKKALAKAIELAKICNSELILLSVGTIPAYAETISEIEEAKEQALNYYEKIQKEILDRARKENLKLVPLIRFGKPAEAIVNTAEELKVDLIIVGAGEHPYLVRRILGSTADRVVDSASCSVLVVR